MTAWGSGGLIVEFDALFKLSVLDEPDALVEISVPIFGRLATPRPTHFSFLNSPQVSIAAVAVLRLERCVSGCFISLLME
jgi:hypothetical protein